ncbi:hypothetical protein [Candidatus Formimonas warabiya]|uniref:Uncharacterized protein n=1 Tax=Formimonas warabiya TaxID=1761012 RepID=A0A3G1KN39_FORW1|nr:hypothetical protein [Candidatus Formimonas warabiya]ATW23879.1 hypothetical protein DCMF_02855 [Candidatus Formimonas warabiya]
MFLGCPLCNGVTTPGPCEICGTPMEDLGMVEDYAGPYSPYQDGELIELEHKRNHKSTLICIHLIYCPTCKYDDYLEVPI